MAGKPIKKARGSQTAPPSILALFFCVRNYWDPQGPFQLGNFQFPFCLQTQSLQSYPQLCSRSISRACPSIYLHSQWMLPNHAVDPTILLPSIPLCQSHQAETQDICILLPVLYRNLSSLMPSSTCFQGLVLPPYLHSGGLHQTLERTQLFSFQCTL